MSRDYLKEALEAYENNKLADGKTMILLTAELIKEIRRMRNDIKKLQSK